jgi:NADPH:quinone reductase
VFDEVFGNTGHPACVGWNDESNTRDGGGDMRAVRISETGGPEVLKPTQLPTPQPRAGELLVDVAASGVNYIDTYYRTGAYPMQLPATLGLEAAGTVREVGAEVTGFAPGERVAWPQSPGSYAEQVVVPADRVVKVPEGVSDEAAATLLQGMTAHYLLHDSYPVRAGDTVLVHAAAGGMGLLLTQWATALGARVIGTVSTLEKEQIAREAGAAEVIRYTEQDFTAETRRLTDGDGVAAVYDGVGATTFDGSLASLRRRGTLVVYGAASGPVPPFDLQRLNRAGSVYLTRPSLVHFIATREELTARGDAVFAAMRAGKLTVRIGHRYPLAEAARAHADLESRRTSGKLLLLP